MAETVDRAPVATERKLGGCPVVHQDYSEPKEACGYLRQADDMRESAPLFFNEYAQGYWVFTRHDAVKDMYKNPDIFSNESITPWEPDPVYRFIPTQIDPPEHIKYRRIVNPWFSPARRRGRGMVRDVCRKYVEEVAPKGGCDFVTTFALQYPTEVFLRMIGADAAMTDKFVEWVEDFFKGFGGDPAGIEPMTNAVAAISGYWERVVAERIKDPEPREGDLASHIVHSTVDDRPITEVEAKDMLLVLTLAGLDTTRGTLGYIFRHLADHPEHRRRLIAEPELIPLFCEEATRYYTIIFGDGRKVTRDVEFHGASLKKGDMVYGLVAGANRDPRV